MARLRQKGGERLRRSVLEFETLFADLCEEADPDGAGVIARDRVEALRSHRPVVGRGMDFDLPDPYSGPWCLESDGSLVPVEAVVVDRTVIGYARMDGSLVDRGDNR